jgi:hypothetical protein|tara:strand:+ start:14035 stop:14325 length:291 start_codon:yes stop_codon:yes gene_type:complete
MDWYRKILLRARKKRALLEIRTDISFIKNYRADWLNFDESKARVELRKLYEAGEEKKDNVKINKISKNIALHQATKKEYDDLIKLETDIMAYIKMI